MDATSPGYNAHGPAASLALRQGGAADVRQALLAARARTLALADDYAAAIGAAAVPCRAGLNPPLWELGHVAWFQEWWLARNPQRWLGAACDPLCARAPALLPQADGWYDSSRVAHRARWDLPLPDAAGTRAYLAQTLAGTLALLDALPQAAGDAALYFFRLVALHEQMHAEAAVYMARELGIALREPLPMPRYAGAEQLRLAARRFRLGSAIDGGFAFDNELQAHDVAIEALEIDAHPVSWERFLPFVESGGYRGALVPPADLQQPVLHVNAEEAEAWCRWAGRRLPTEAEWECAALTLPGFAWGSVWEWTGSAFLPYPGFVPHPYLDYSAPWFGSRRVLRGASLATAPALAHARYRNFFEPWRRDIFAGFRSCRAGFRSPPPR